MATYGMTDKGFVPKTLDVIINEKKSEVLNNIRSDANVSDESVFGQLINDSAERESEIVDLIQKVVLNGTPNTATGISLDNAVSFNNLVRKQAGYSRVVTQVFNGSAGLTIPNGTRISVSGSPLVVFSTDSEVVLTSGTNEIQTFTYSISAISGFIQLSYEGEIFNVQFDDAGATIKATLEALPNVTSVTVTGDGGTGFTVEFTGVDGLQPKSPITEVTSTLSGVGSVNVLVGIVATQEGQYQGSCSTTAINSGSSYAANAETLTVFEDAVPGGITTYNLDDAIVGRDVETDSELYLRQKNSVGLGGGSTMSSVISDILAISGVDSVRGVDNDTDLDDVAGRPAGSFEMYVYQVNGNTDAEVDLEVAEAIWANKPIGTRTWSSYTLGDPEFVSADIVDSQGVTREVLFSRPTPIYIWLVLDITATASKFGLTNALALKQEIIDYGNALGPGEDVIVYPYLMELFSNYSGITDVAILIEGSTSDTVDPVPTLDDNIVIADGSSTGNAEVSRWKSGLISMTLNGTPV